LNHQQASKRHCEPAFYLLGLRIAGRSDKGEVVISDGERAAPYELMQGWSPLCAELPIARRMVQQGRLPILTDGKRQVVYVPVGQPGPA